MNTEELNLLRDTAGAFFRARRDHALHSPDAFWTDLRAQGMGLIGIDEAHGGDGGSIEQLCVVLTEAGRSALPAPLLATHVAALLLAGGGHRVGAGPLASVLGGGLHLVGGRVESEAAEVAWGSTAQSIVVVVAPVVLAVVPAGACRWRYGSDLAREPRDALVDVDPSQVTLLDIAPEVVQAARLHELLGRAALLQGAAERALELTVDFVKNRQQFGRPLAALQAVQQSVAVAASHVAAGAAAVAGAVAAVDAAGAGRVADAEFPVLACTTQLSRSALVVYRTAHQLHGAIGFTEEHSLHQVTTRLMAWRSQSAGAVTNTRIARLGYTRADPWALVTAT